MKAKFTFSVLLLKEGSVRNVNGAYANFIASIIRWKVSGAFSLLFKSSAFQLNPKIEQVKTSNFVFISERRVKTKIDNRQSLI